MARVLVVDDDAGIRESAAMALAKAGHRTEQASDAASALQLLRQRSFDVIVSDIYMPGDDGLQLLAAVSERKDPPKVILMTGRGSVETTTLAQRFGAFDYLSKPFELAELIDCVRRAVTISTEDSVQVEPAPASRMIGADRTMVEMYKAITRVASLPVPVLVLGESGSGKELVAQALHDLGVRSAGPFIALNCGAIPDTLLENELFGSSRGAYTDSRQDRRGALLRADGGTLFLDEVGDISPAFQVKLLRFLQDGMVTPLGSEKTQKVDVRVVAATHRDIRRLIGEGVFREDLYYRLAGYEIRVPPLRERTSDIPLLVEHFRHKIAVEMRRESIPGPSRAVLDLLCAHRWRGNVRELEQVVRRMAIDSGGLLDVHAAENALREVDPLREDPGQPEENAATEPEVAEQDGLHSLDEAEKRHIIAVLRATGGNQTQAAYILGVERKTLARKMKKLEISIGPGAL